MLKPATIDASTQFLYLTFEDLCFTGTTNTGGSNTVGVDLTSTRLCSFERCHFEWFTSCGILIQCGPNGGNGANDSIAHTIHACFFNNNVGSAPGVWFRTNPSDLHASGQGYSQIDSCFFNGNGNDNVGIMGPTAKTKITNNHFMAVVWPLIGVFQQCVFSQNSAENFAYGSSSWTGAGGVGFNLPANGPGFGTLTGQQNYMVLMAFNHYAVPNVGTKGVNIITAPGFGGLQRVFDHDGYGVFAYHTELTAGGGTSYGVGDSIVPPF